MGSFHSPSASSISHSHRSHIILSGPPSMHSNRLGWNRRACRCRVGNNVSIRRSTLRTDLKRNRATYPNGLADFFARNVSIFQFNSRLLHNLGCMALAFHGETILKHNEMETLVRNHPHVLISTTVLRLYYNYVLQILLHATFFPFHFPYVSIQPWR